MSIMSISQEIGAKIYENNDSKDSEQQDSKVERRGRLLRDDNEEKKNRISIIA